MHDFSDETIRVTTLELFFDLVFVFTITQLTTVLVRQPTWRVLRFDLGSARSRKSGGRRGARRSGRR